jgi:hypothetical protein
MEKHGNDLRAIGHEVMSEWVWKENATLDERWRQGHADALREVAMISWRSMMEVFASDALVIFSEHHGAQFPEGNSGGRHVELGMMIAHRMDDLIHPKRIIIVGPRENIFMTHDWMERVDHWPDALVALGAAPLVARAW